VVHVPGRRNPKKMLIVYSVRWMLFKGYYGDRLWHF